MWTHTVEVGTGHKIGRLHPEIGPNYTIEPNGSFETFRGFEIFLDSSEQVRKNLSICQFYRTVAPWVTENPIMMHVRNADESTVKNAIDQCAEVGFEMVILRKRFFIAKTPTSTRRKTALTWGTCL